MGSTAKTLTRLMDLTRQGHLAPGAEICDIGATQLFGGATKDAAAFLDFYAGRTPAAKPSADVPAARIAEIANGGFLGDLLKLAGFRYVALDIFHATDTVLFDLNVHAPGPRLRGRFDLVMNFGTTEHVINQFRAFQTIHDLTKPGGLMYHDLPMAGFLNHALFRYDPLFFRTVIPANSYETILQEITIGAAKPVPDQLRALGFRKETIEDVGIEIVVRRIGLEGFKVPLETTTALSVDPNFSNVAADEMVEMPAGTVVTYGSGGDLDEVRFDMLTRVWLRRALRGARRRLGI